MVALLSQCFDNNSISSSNDKNTNVVANNDSSDLTIPDSIFHLGDTNTKIRFPAADTISFETAGSEKLRITSDGDILTSGNTQLFGSNTSDGSDNKAIMINGGGAVSDSRGVY